MVRDLRQTSPIQITTVRPLMSHWLQGLEPRQHLGRQRHVVFAGNDLVAEIEEAVLAGH